MKDWVVAVKRRGIPSTKRVFVENIEHEDEAAQLALLKLGASPHEHETRVDLIDKRVSVENPNYDPEKMYEEALIELAEARRACHEAETLSTLNSERVERVERERDRLIRIVTLTETDLNLVRSKLDDIHKGLGMRRG